MNLFPVSTHWITRDNRSKRQASRTTASSLNARHMAMLPPEVIAGKSVLDLGCCIASTGWWSMKNGAGSYTGVETQSEYVDIARELLATDGVNNAEVIQADAIGWMESLEPTRKWDIGVLAGVLYGFLDPYLVLRLMARHCNSIVIDTLYPLGQRNNDFSFIEILPKQRMILADDDTHQAAGHGVRLSPKALEIIMESNGFVGSKVEVPPSHEKLDAYHTLVRNPAGTMLPLRYMHRYDRSDTVLLSVNDQIVNNQVTEKLPFATVTAAK